MTKEELLKIGCKEIEYNSGSFYGYYLPITGDGRGFWHIRLEVRYGEYKNSVATYLMLPQGAMSKIRLEHVTTVEQFKTFYLLMTGKEV